MRIRLLPSSCIAPARLQPLTTFLVNGRLAIDGGSLGLGLAPPAQRRVRAVVVTHAHADHIASLPVFLAEGFPFLKEPLRVYSVPEIIRVLGEHVFNDRVSPDFRKIRLRGGGGPALRFVEVRPLVPFEVEGVRLTAVETNHTVPTIGLALEDRRSAVVVTSDTHATEEIWRVANRLDRLRAIFVDVSYPDGMEELAAASKHLTPGALEGELRKLERPVPILAFHLKPQFQAEVRRQLARLKSKGVTVVTIGRDYEF